MIFKVMFGKYNDHTFPIEDVQYYAMHTFNPHNSFSDKDFVESYHVLVSY